jgi:hypothetical protein
MWAFGNGDTVQSENPIYCYDDSGTFDITLTVTSSVGCSSTLKLRDYIRVYPKPNAAFVISPQPASILAPTIQFTDQSTDAYGIIYRHWSFGDNSTDTIQNPVHTYHDTGNYCATLQLTDIHGCTDTVSHCLSIENEIASVYLYPNVGNGVFTLKWVIKNTQSTFVNFNIVDVLGQEVYAAQVQSNIGFNTEPLDLERLAEGTYFLRMKIDNTKSITKFVIVKHNRL